MSIKINSNFQIGTPQPLDYRNVLTKEEMKNVNENVWPEAYYTICKDDGKIYTFNKGNESTEETGKFRLLDTTAIITEEITPNVKIGSIDGSKISTGTEITSILKDMLIQSIPPIVTLSTPKDTFSISETITGTVTVNVDDTNSTASSIISIVEGESNDITQTKEFAIDSAKTYTVKVTYMDSVKGIEQTTTSEITISTIVPIYYIASDTNEITSELIQTMKMAAPNNGVAEISITADNQYIIFTSAVEIKSILDSNGFENIDSFEFKESSVEQYSNNCYVSKDKITCTNFKYVVKS